MKTPFTLFITIMLHLHSFSQERLSLEQAVKIALKNNFDLRLSSNVVEQTENNNTLGNAGMLPVVNLDGSYTRSSNSVNQKYSNGQEVDKDASLSTNTFADAGADWIIFDGLRMFSTKNKLGEFSFLSRDQQKIEIENTVENVTDAYYFLIRQQQLLKAIEEELKLTDDRVKLTDRKFKNGSGSKLDWLQAKTEFNRQRSLQITLETQAAAAYANLNKLLGRDIETKYLIEDSVVISYRPSYDELKKSVPEKNNEIAFYKRNQKIAQLELKEAKSLRWPTIGLNADYMYSKSTNENGFTLLNQLQGFNYGITATLPLFDGFNINRQIKNAKLQTIYSDISLEYANLNVRSELYNAYTVFTNNYELLLIEEENIGYAREVLMIANERYRIGVSNSTEQLEAQRTFEEAMKRLADARYFAKVSETRLRKLNGELVR